MENSAVKTWSMAVIAGLVASLLMYIILYLYIFVWGWAPFNTTPSAAFLENLGLNRAPYPLLVHFLYGTLWSVVLVYVFEEDVTVIKGLTLAGILWFFMMLVYSPIIGWGMFGAGYAHLLKADHILYLEQGADYMISTLLVHVVYGLVVGWMNARL